MDPGSTINVYYEHDGAYPRINVLDTRCTTRGTVWKDTLPLRTIGNFTTSCEEAAEVVRPTLEVVINMACFDPIPEDKRTWRFCVSDAPSHRMAFEFWDGGHLAVTRVYCFASPEQWSNYTLLVNPEGAVLNGAPVDECNEATAQKEDDLTKLGSEICRPDGSSRHR
ncbi:hypothetical protein FOZ62_018387 [Perkinsus olseni]|uniref:Uncharacterized protein n=2 Tax=Perkinsus olseni TaxID=32597 RepID=A0A7J6RSN1_PEROL|nr:hypothetical protein FOZ62_018387 [Perkinsus olseni]